MKCRIEAVAKEYIKSKGEAPSCICISIGLIQLWNKHNNLSTLPIGETWIAGYRLAYIVGVTDVVVAV